MQYGHVVAGRFVARPNRFVAQVEIDGRVETVHVKNTGRCRELVLPGSVVYLAVSDNPARKTRCDLIAVEKERPGKPPLLINLDSQIPNDVAGEWLRQGGLFPPDATVRREMTFGTSRFDFAIEQGGRKAYLEVKGVTLEQDGLALFPDAPTERGVKHLRELAACRAAGLDAYLLFVVAMKEIRAVRPNDVMHPAFGEALRQARDAGVRILALDCIVTPDSIVADAPVTVEL